MDQIERIKNRLDNIRGVEPILSALRTISMGSRQSVLDKKDRATRYSHHLMTILAYLKPMLGENQANQLKLRDNSTTQEHQHTTLILVIGTERGLCGRFNHAVASKAFVFYQERIAAGEEVELWILGSRLMRILGKQNLPVSRMDKMSITATPSYHRAAEYTDQWLNRYESSILDQIFVIYNIAGAMGTYNPTILQSVPFSLHIAEDRSMQEAWPSPIIETDPLSLSGHILKQMVSIQVYKCLLESAAAEHATRFHILEDATQNAHELIEDLYMEVLAARRQTITREMQTLAVGAGLVGEAGE